MEQPHIKLLKWQPHHSTSLVSCGRCWEETNQLKAHLILLEGRGLIMACSWLQKGCGFSAPLIKKEMFLKNLQPYKPFTRIAHFLFFCFRRQWLRAWQTWRGRTCGGPCTPEKLWGRRRTRKVSGDGKQPAGVNLCMTAVWASLISSRVRDAGCHFPSPAVFAEKHLLH